MKLFANIREIAKILFRQNGQEIGLDSNTSTTYTADRNVELPPGDTDSVLVGAANTQVLTNKTIDGDDNTVQDLPLTAIKTVLGDADKVILRDASGVPTSSLIVNANIDAAAAIAATKIGNGDVDNTELSKLNGLSGAITTDTNTQTLTNKTLTSPVINTPTGIVKGDVGLGNVDNTSDATKNSAAVTLTNKTIDGDDNTVQDLALSSLKTVLGDADKVIRRNASGVVVSDNAIPNSSTILTTDATQILSNKELDQAVMNGQIVPDYIDMEEVAAPGNPTAGTTRYYTKTDGLLYSRDNAGVESPVGSGASLASADGDTAGTVKTFVPEVKSSIHTVTSADYTILDNDGFETIVISTGASNRTVTLPAVANNQGRKIRLIKADSAVGNILLDAAGSETLNGLTVSQIACGTQYDTYEVICDSTLGWIINEPSAQSYSLVMDGSFSAGTINIRKLGQVVIMEVNTMVFGSSAAPTMSSAISPIFAPAFNTSAIVEFNGSRVVSLECSSAGIVSLTFRDWAGSGFAQTSLSGSYTLTWLKRG